MYWPVPNINCYLTRGIAGGRTILNDVARQASLGLSVRTNEIEQYKRVGRCPRPPCGRQAGVDILDSLLCHLNLLNAKYEFLYGMGSMTYIACIPKSNPLQSVLAISCLVACMLSSTHGRLNGRRALYQQCSVHRDLLHFAH